MNGGWGTLLVRKRPDVLFDHLICPESLER